MRAYTQLTQEQRYQIHAFMKTGFTQKDIALEIRAQSSTVSRELRRNSSLRGYRPQQAHEKTMIRRRNKAQPRIDESTWDLVETLIRRDWSPEQISGRLRAERGHCDQPRMDLPPYLPEQAGGRRSFTAHL